MQTAETTSIENLYTPAMLAELLGIHVRSVRRWQSVSLLKPTTEVMQLPYFDYAALAIARQLAKWTKQGLSARGIRDQLNAFHKKLGQNLTDQMLLERLQVDAEGKQLTLRIGDMLVEASGQLRLQFEDHDGESSETIYRFERPAASTAHGQRQLFLRDAPEVTLEAMIDAAIEAEDEGDFETAVDWYRASLSAHGPNADICFQIAELLYRKGDTAGARERYFMALELNPDLVEARANLGCVLSECGQLELAIAAFEGTLQQHPDYADVHFHLARTLDDNGNTTQAAEHWMRFLELSPESPWADEARTRLHIAAPILQEPLPEGR